MCIDAGGHEALIKFFHFLAGYDPSFYALALLRYKITCFVNSGIRVVPLRA
jgi:hypothetical protein